MTTNCMTVSEMARRLGIGRNNAYLLANSEGFYPAFKLGGRRIIISEEALSRWMAEQTSAASTENGAHGQNNG